MQDAGSKYSLALAALLNSLGARLIVNVNDLRDFDAGLAHKVLTAPMDTVPHLEAALKEVRPLATAGLCCFCFCGPSLILRCAVVLRFPA